MWLLLSLVAGFFYTIQGLLSRHLLKKTTDAWAFSFYFSLVGALTALPFMLWKPQLAQSPGVWLLLLIVCGLIVGQNFLQFSATQYLEASVQGAITKFRLLWVLLIGVVFLGESVSGMKVIGTILTVLAGLLIYSGTLPLNSKRGISLALAATLMYAVVIGLYKLLFTEFNSVTLTFFIFAIPAALNFILMPNALHRIQQLAQTQGKTVLVATILGGLANLAMNQALTMGEATKVLVIIEAFLLVILIGEHFFLNERRHLVRKAITVILATAGAVLIRLAS